MKFSDRDYQSVSSENIMHTVLTGCSFQLLRLCIVSPNGVCEAQRWIIYKLAAVILVFRRFTECLMGKAMFYVSITIYAN